MNHINIIDVLTFNIMVNIKNKFNFKVNYQQKLLVYEHSQNEIE